MSAGPISIIQYDAAASYVCSENCAGQGQKASWI